ncbi:MAG TPA: hypothetical protein VMX17_03595 [Candidatus Glassbacteria bacterium]|nr:hypothetical protein [Candidatus Glassbacteria bacterium]
MKQKAPDEEPAPAPVPTPPTKQEENIDLTPDQMAQLTKQIDKIEQKEVPKEVEVSEEVDEDAQKVEQLQAEFERLQNTGVFRAEILYQCLGMNANLDRIATAIEKLTGENA